MGLAEKRAAKEFQEKRFPAFKKEVDDAVGFEVPFEVKWEQLSEDGYGASYDEFWSKVYFKPLIAALKAIAIDDMGKDALKGSLKSILIRNEGGIYYGDRMAIFEKSSGRLTLDHKPSSNVDNVEERKNGIQKTLEDAL